MKTEVKKHHPILFSTHMVQAILEGRKTQTRRVVKPQPLDQSFVSGYVTNSAGEFGIALSYGKSADIEFIKFPYGKPGDILWVREMFFNNGDEIIYRADGTCCEQFEQCECIEIGKPKWKPSIHMPKAACRIFLEIIDVRIDRIQGITNEDAKAEGVIRGENSFIGRESNGWVNYLEPDNYLALFDNPRCSFFSLWDSINGRDSRNNNPFVWVIEFKRVDKPANWPS